MKSFSTMFTPDLGGRDVVTLDDVLIYLGEFGLYQRGLFMMLMPFCLFLSFVYFTQMFITLVPEEHWCTLPRIENTSVEFIRELAVPKADAVRQKEAHHSLPYSRCWMYDVPIDEIIKSDHPHDGWPIKRCESWDFNFTRQGIPYSTIATELQWVCEDAYLMNLAQSMFFVGAICGGLLFGWVADKYGRIPVLMGTNLMAFVGGLCTIFTTSFWQFSVCRFIVGFAFDNTFVIMYILCLEYVGPNWRTFAANVGYGVFYTMGSVVMPWLAYSIADWKLFAIVTSVPLASVVFTPWILPESIRWLLSEGKIEKAVLIMMRIEKINGTDVPQGVFEDFIDECMDTAENNPKNETSVLDLFKTPRLRNTTIILIVSWSIMAMVYDGHIRCLDQLDLDIFTTFTIGASTEFPAVLLIMYTLDEWGRKWTLFSFIIISGLASFGACCVPIGIYFASFAMIGRLFINSATNIALQYAAELLPTVVRGKGVATIHILGYVSSILSPFVAYSATAHRLMPMIILGTSSIFCGFLGLFLPETLKEELPQTLMDGELFGIDQAFWEFPCLKSSRFFRGAPRPSHAVDLMPNKHYLHANVPAQRAAMLRSSMVSGLTGNKRRITAVRDYINREGVRPRRSSLAVSTSPIEYVEHLRKGYRERSAVLARLIREEGDSSQSQLELRKDDKEKKKKVRVKLDDIDDDDEDEAPQNP